MVSSLELGVVLLLGSVTLCRGWRVVLKVAAGEDVSPGTSLFDLWTSSNHLNDDAAGIAQVTDTYSTPNTPSYKSRIVNNWAKSNVQNVKVGMYRDGVEVVNIVFNNSWSDDLTSWFSAENIVQQGQRYTDLSPGNNISCSAEGFSDLGLNVSQSDLGHRFLITSIMSPSPECDTMRGWLVVVDKGRIGQCHWDYGYSLPFFLYSPNRTSTTMLKMITASVFVIFVDDCVDNPCKFGGKCNNHLGVTNCVCSDQYYGHTCETVCPCQYGSCVKQPAGSGDVSRNFEISGEILSCNCTAGHSGVNCDQDIDDCLGDPCLNGAECIDDIQGYTCECPVGYHGTNCETTKDKEVINQSTTGAIIAVAVIVPLVVIVIILGVIYGIYIKRNPDGYGRSTIYKHSAIARDFVRRSFRRMSGRGRPRQNKELASKETTNDNKNIISSDQISFEYDNSGFRDGEDDDGFGDGDSSKRGYSRQDSEHIDLTPEDQSVISGESVRTKTPPALTVGYTKYLDPRQTGRSHSTSPRLDAEHPYPDSSQDSNTSGSLYQEMNPGLTPDYGPAYQPDVPPHYDNISIQQKAAGAHRVESKRPEATPRKNRDRRNQNVKPPSYDSYNKGVQRSDDRYNPGQPPPSAHNKPDIVPQSHGNQVSYPRSNDRYNPDPVVRYKPQSVSADRYNTDSPPLPNDRYNVNPDIQPHSRHEVQPRSDDQHNASSKNRPVKLDFNADARNRHPDKHTPTRGSRPSPGYSPRNPTSPGTSTSPGYSPGNPTSLGYDRSHPRQARTPSRESPPQGTVILEDGEPIREISI